MTTTNPQGARLGGQPRASSGFRRWRRSRPYWGGLLTIKAGIEIFLTTQMSLNGLTFHTGPTGFLSWLIPVVLVTCGLLLWFSPQQRLFYSVVASMTAVYSLIAVNLGGFFIGMLLGMVGGALGFAWMPGKTADVTEQQAEPTEGDDDSVLVHTDGAAVVDPYGSVAENPSTTTGQHRQQTDEQIGLLTDTLPAPRNPLGSTVGLDGPAVPGRSTSRPLFTVTLLLLGLTATGLAGLSQPTPAGAAPAGCAGSTPKPGASASPSPTPSSADTPSNTDPGNTLVGGIVDGVTGLLTGDTTATPTGSPTPTAEPTTAPAPAPTGKPKPSGGGCVPVKPPRPRPARPGQPLPRVAVAGEQPPVAGTPGRLTGSQLTMYDLRIVGVVELPTKNGTIKALKFTMSKAVTADFQFLAPGAGSTTMRYRTGTHVADGHVSVYATRFVGWLLGAQITLTPDQPLPDGLPVTLPIASLKDPVIDLVFLDCDVMSSKGPLQLDLIRAE